MRKQLLYLFSVLVLNDLIGQDIHFSQYYVAPQLINPSAFGALNSFEGGLQYKGQWNSFTNGYTSFAAFANKSFKKQKDANSSRAYFSAGLNVIYDKAGSNQLTHFKAELPVNVTKKVGSSSFLTGGLYAGFGQLAAKNDNFTWGSQFDGYQYNSALGSNEVNTLQSKSYLDCGAGLTFITLSKGREAAANAPQNVTGFSISHLNRPDYSLYGTSSQKLGMRINFYEYYHIYFANSPFSLVPSLLVQYQSKAYELVVGTYLRHAFKDNSEKSSKYLSIGAFYRLQDMCALSCMIEMNQYSLGVNYDFNISRLITTSRSFGGLELSLKMNSPFQYAPKAAGNIQGNKF